MVTEADVRKAMEAGSQFEPAILKAIYDHQADNIIFVTPWGDWIIKREAVEFFRNLQPFTMTKLYASQTGVHIDEVDLDINSAGLLAHLFPELRHRLTHSF